MGALHARGLIPLRLAELQAHAPAAAGRRPRRRDLQPFTQQLATLLGAGLQLDRALYILADLTQDEPMGATVAMLRRDLQEGATFSAALERHPRLFGRVYINMVRAGETGGVLPAVLQRLAQTLEEEQELGSYILGTLLYPAIVALVGLGAFIFLLAVVVPAFERIFKQLHQTLPGLTRITIALSHGLTAYGLWILGALALLAILAWQMLRGQEMRERLDRFYLRLPLCGDLYTKLATARISRTLSLLANAGVPILQAFAVVQETMRNRVVAKALRQAGQEIKEGGGIARRLEAQKILPQLAIEMIAVGEETGELPKMLEQVAKGYDIEVKRAIRTALALLEPILILGLTAMTLLIALSILIPIISINTNPNL